MGTETQTDRQTDYNNPSLRMRARGLIIHREKNMKNNKLKDKDKQKMCGGVKVSCSNYSTPENTIKVSKFVRASMDFR